MRIEEITGITDFANRWNTEGITLVENHWTKGFELLVENWVSTCTSCRTEYLEKMFDDRFFGLVENYQNEIRVQEIHKSYDYYNKKWYEIEKFEHIMSLYHAYLEYPTEHYSVYEYMNELPLELQNLIETYIHAEHPILDDIKQAFEDNFNVLKIEFWNQGAKVSGQGSGDRDQLPPTPFVLEGE